MRLSRNREKTDMTQIMGILNVTPDSFSDGGCYLEDEALRARIAALLAEGADLIDVGGESTRPGAEPVTLAEELARVLPALRAVRAQSATVPISVDTTKAEVARQALLAGASMINDISALEADPAMLEVLLNSSAEVVLMHRQGDPQTMQLAPRYHRAAQEIADYLSCRVAALEAAGIARSRIIVDPGLGFGKTLAHNLDILRHLPDFAALGCRLLIGHSRKSFLGEITGQRQAADRDLATAVLSAFCAAQGVHILRVHNVRTTKEALLVQEALASTL